MIVQPPFWRWIAFPDFYLREKELTSFLKPQLLWIDPNCSFLYLFSDSGGNQSSLLISVVTLGRVPWMRPSQVIGQTCDQAAQDHLISSTGCPVPLGLPIGHMHTSGRPGRGHPFRRNNWNVCDHGGMSRMLSFASHLLESQLPLKFFQAHGLKRYTSLRYQ